MITALPMLQNFLPHSKETAAMITALSMLQIFLPYCKETAASAGPGVHSCNSAVFPV